MEYGRLTGVVERSEAECVSKFVGDKCDSGVVGPGLERARGSTDTDRLATTLFNCQSVIMTRTCRWVISLTPQRHVTEPQSYHLHNILTAHTHHSHHHHTCVIPVNENGNIR